MKILCVIDSLGSGGAQRQMVTLAAGLSSRGHAVEFFVYYSEDHFRRTLHERSIAIHFHAKRGRLSISPLLALRRLIATRTYDVVLSFLDTPNVYAELACLRARRPRLVVSERFMFLSENGSVLSRGLRQFHRLADALTVNSDHHRTALIKALPWLGPRTQTIYNGYDLDCFRRDEHAPSHDNTLRLIAVASTARKKNSLNLAKAMAICHLRHGLRATVTWVGRTSDVGEVSRGYDETVACLKTTGTEHLWTWTGERSDIPELLNSHDALAHPSFHEGLPNSICEALACGRPVLASRVCDHPALVQDGSSGYLFNPQSPDDIAKTILRFSDLPPNTRENMGRAARRYAEEHLSLARMTDEYEQLFQTLLRSNRSVGIHGCD
jgi:glycosyltransferase involved in cell wall biosynthesis